MGEKPRRQSNFWWDALDLVRRVTDRATDAIRSAVGLLRWW